MCTDKQKALELLASAVALLTHGEVQIKKQPQTTCNCCCNTRPTNNWCPTPKPQARPQQFDKEPDGVNIIVDRPRLENYCGNRQKWAMDMANYRTLIDQAKKCDGIKTRVPQHIPSEVHNGRRDWYEDHGFPTAPQRPNVGPSFIPPFVSAKPCIARIVEEWEW